MANKRRQFRGRRPTLLSQRNDLYCSVVLYLHMCPIHPTHRHPCHRAQHELRHRSYWRRDFGRFRCMGSMGQIQFLWFCTDSCLGAGIYRRQGMIQVYMHYVCYSSYDTFVQYNLSQPSFTGTEQEG